MIARPWRSRRLQRAPALRSCIVAAAAIFAGRAESADMCLDTAKVERESTGNARIISFSISGNSTWNSVDTAAPPSQPAHNRERFKPGQRLTAFNHKLERSIAGRPALNHDGGLWHRTELRRRHRGYRRRGCINHKAVQRPAGPAAGAHLTADRRSMPAASRPRPDGLMASAARSIIGIKRALGQER